MPKANRKPREKTPEEVKLDAFDKQHEGKTLTDAQNETRDKLDHAVRAAKWKKGAELHGLRIINSADKLTGLANAKRYRYTPAQVESLKAALEKSLKAMVSAYEGKQTAATKLDLTAK